LAKKRVLPSSWAQPETKQEPHSEWKSAPTYNAPVASSSSFGAASIVPHTYVAEEETQTNVARVFLSNEQQKILKLVEAGNNVFFTGSAGKSIISIYNHCSLILQYP
jgi:ATP-dependent DNA helicase PIF1